MNSNEIINELEKVESKYKDKVFSTGELNIYEMVKSCKYKIQELQQENQQLKEQLEKERKARKEAIDLCNKYIKEINDLHLRIYPKEYYELLEILDIDKGE